MFWDILRKKYPNAKILGWVKEVNVANDMRLRNRVRFLNECDAVITSGISEKFKNIDMFKYLRSVVDKKFYFISQPVNIDYLFDNFYNEEKDLSIWAYLPNPLYRRGKTYEFAMKLDKLLSLSPIDRSFKLHKSKDLMW